MSDPSSLLDTAVKVGGWAVSALMFVWIMSRRTQGWDRGNQAWLQLNGDKDSKDKDERSGFIESYRAAQDRLDRFETMLTSVSDRVRAIQDGLDAHGSRSDIIAANVRKSLAEKAQQAAEARENRRRLMEGQYFPDRDSDSFVDPVAPPHRVPRPDPRREPDEPFRSDDTGRHRALGPGGRKKP